MTQIDILKINMISVMKMSGLMTGACLGADLEYKVHSWWERKKEKTFRKTDKFCFSNLRKSPQDSCSKMSEN